MLRIATTLFGLGLLVAVQPASAAPPENAKPLSDIVKSLEGEANFGHVKDIEWDDDGYWEVEYVRTDGSGVEVELDPVSGHAMTR